MIDVEEYRCDEDSPSRMCGMCKAEMPWRCYRTTPEAFTNRERRARIRAVVERVMPPSFWQRHTRFAAPRWGSLDELLKDAYGPTYHPYERSCIVNGLQVYESRRFAVFGRGKHYRPRYKIAEQLGVKSVNEFAELIYKERPLFALIPRTAPRIR